MPAVNEAVVIAFRDAAEFEAWLDAHVDLRVGVWLKIAKKGSGVPSLTDDEAVELGLCYGGNSRPPKAPAQGYLPHEYAPPPPPSRWAPGQVAHGAGLIAARRERA